MFDDFFSMDSPFFRFMAKVADFMILNVLFIICSIPIVTMGASFTAMYDVLTKMDTKKEVPAASGFIKAFKSNLKTSTKLWLIILGVAVFLLIDLYLVGNVVPMSINVQVTLFIVFLVMLFVWVMASGYILVLQARIENPIGRTIKMAFALTLVHLIPNSIFTGVISLVPIVLLFGFTQIFFAIFPVWIFGGISVLAYLNSKIYMKILKKYVPELKDDNKVDEYKPLESLSDTKVEAEEENHG